MGGNHWPIHNHAINHVPGWHQNRTLEPLVSGVLRGCAGQDEASLFDDGPGSPPAEGAVELTVYARGHLASPVTLTVKSAGGGRLSKSRLTLPAGANSQDSFTYVPEANRVSTLSYQREGTRGQVPPPRKVFSFADPVAHAARDLEEAAMALMARYAASRWLLSDAHTDYMLGRPAVAGQEVRAISDSGFGSSPGNAMEMLNWINTSAGMGRMKVPVMRLVNGHACSDHTAPQTWGFWCKKSLRRPRIQPDPANRVLYNLEDSHFVIAALSVPGDNNSGVVFQASQTEKAHASELFIKDGLPSARWRDANGQLVQLAGKQKLPAGAPVVMSLTSRPGAQSLRVNSAELASAGATLGASEFNQMLIGWGYLNYFPGDGFGGHMYAVVAGKGAPSDAELQVMERYLGSLAGMAPSRFQPS
jgi:hypothetical protein